MLHYTYACNTTSNTYTLTMPGSDLTESLHGTTKWCDDPFEVGTASNTKIAYVNGELVYCTFVTTIVVGLSR
jgi:quinol-cytochrome oxidoreductase complex cytochrome b subunit